MSWHRRTQLFQLLLVATLLAACAGDRDTFGSHVSAVYRFPNVAARDGVQSDDSRSWGATWNDFDSDGDADLFAGRHWRVPGFFINRGDHFTPYRKDRVFEKVADRHGCAWGEANGDGKPDLYCVQGADKGEGSGANQLFIQTADGFEERGEEFGVQDLFGRGRTVNWIDLDVDGDLDLFLGNHLRPGHPNVTFLNRGGHFDRVDVGLTEELSTIGSSWADWDRDGDNDLLLNQLEPNPTIAYENQGGTFVRTEIPLVTGKPWKSGAWGDYNGDGWPDLHLVSSDRSLVMQNRHGTFHPESDIGLSEGRMSAWLDLENDGDLDLYIVQGAASEDYQPVEGALDEPDLFLIRSRGGFIGPLRQSLRGQGRGNGDAVAVSDHDRDGRVDIFVSNGYFHSRGYSELLKNHSRAGNWIGIDLDGGPSNPQGIGVKVKVVTRTRTIWRQMTDGVAFRSQSEIGYFHIGISGNEVATMEIVWPDGTRDCRSAVTDHVFVVKKGSLGCAATKE
jgi:hypothetical protein